MSTLVKAFSKVCEKSCRMLNQLPLTHIAVAAASESHHSLLHCMSWKAEHVLLLLLADDKMCEALSRVKLCSGGLSNFLSLPITPRIFFFAKEITISPGVLLPYVYILFVFYVSQLYCLFCCHYHNSTFSFVFYVSQFYYMFFCCCYQNSTFSLSSKYHNSTLSLSSKYQNSTFILSSKYPNSIFSLSSKYHNSTLSLSSMYFSLCLVFLLFSFLFLCQALFFKACFVYL
jgi:hypothetical protein